MDQTVVVTLMPQMIADLERGFSSAAVAQAGWIVTAYLLGFTLVLPLMGRFADLRGHRRTYSLALLIFAAGSLLCSISNSLELLVVFRALQAVGGGALVPIAMAAVAFSFPDTKRALALGIIGGAAEAGSVFGPLYGSWVGQLFGWRALFYFNLPLVLLIYWLVRRYLPRGQKTAAPYRIDYRGAASLALSLTCLTLALSGASQAGWDVFAIPLLTFSLIFLIVFIGVSRRRPHPLIQLSLFSDRAYAASCVAHFLLGIALITALVQIPFFAYSSHWPASADSSPRIGGLLLLRLTLALPIGALLGGWAAEQRPRLPALMGFALSAWGLWQTSRWSIDVGSGRQTFDLVLTGLGFGLVMAPLSLAAINSLKKSRMASGAAVHTGIRIIGMIVGLAALNSWGVGSFQAGLEQNPVPLPRFGLSLERYLAELKAWEQRDVEIILDVLDGFFIVAAAACLLALIPSLYLHRKGSRADRARL